MKRWLVPAIFVAMLGFGLATVWSGSGSASPGVLMALILPMSAWYLVDGQRAARLWFVAVVLIATIVAVSAAPVLTPAAKMTADGNSYSKGQSFGPLKKFLSHEELENFLNANVMYPYSWHFEESLPAVLIAPSLNTPFLPAGVGKGNFIFRIGDDFQDKIDFSTTNIQVEGVDEADIVKTDGECLYVVSGNKVIIINAYPAEDARILSEIEENTDIVEIFINGDKLVVLGRTFAKVYDVSDRENPALKRDVSFGGWYFNSRMIGNYVYLIIHSPTITYTPVLEEFEYSYRIKFVTRRIKPEIVLPKISIDGNLRVIPATEIYYFGTPDYSYVFTTIMAINTQDDDEEITTETILMGTAHNIFVSSNNIYVTYTTYGTTGEDLGAEKTVVHKISIADGEIEYKCFGEVPGHILNQFSMDEYQGHLRIATTTGDVWQGGGTAKNHIYVLDKDLNIVGRLEDLAPGEKIHSARFMGNRVYLVTFKKIDPLFVIDLSDPANPKVLGELKIPGYSDYLHPYDETHIIGIGKDTYDMGDFAWYQGIKVALFDVSDPENPKEISKYIIGDRGTDSLVLEDHKAFLFSRLKNLLVIPISLAEINEEQYPGGVPPDAYGEHVWEGAYVFDISLTDGLVLKGRVTHSEDNVQQGRGWYWYQSSNSIKRSLYIDDVLYTISSGLVKMNDLRGLNELNKIELA